VTHIPPLLLPPPCHHNRRFRKTSLPQKLQKPSANTTESLWVQTPDMRYHLEARINFGHPKLWVQTTVRTNTWLVINSSSKWLVPCSLVLCSSNQACGSRSSYNRRGTWQPAWIVRLQSSRLGMCSPLSTYRQVWCSQILRSAHTVYLCVLCGSQNKQRLFPYTALTDWFL
jgi:hypothetical protein